MTFETCSLHSCGIIIHENKIQIIIRQSDLRQLLENGGKIIAANLVARESQSMPGDLICLTIEAKRKRYGGEVHFSFPRTPVHRSDILDLIDKGSGASSRLVRKSA